MKLILRKKLLIAVLVSFTSTNFGFPQSSISQDLSITFSEELTIGENTGNDADYFLSSPYQIYTDGEQNIYIAEGSQKTIMIFNARGKYIRSIGREGKGPGEFPSGPHFLVNTEDEIVAYDTQSQRLTWFSKQGDILSEYAASEAGMLWSKKFLQTADGNYVVLKKPRIGDDAGNSKKMVLHLYDESFEQQVQSFGDFNDLIPEAGSKFVNMITSRNNAGNVIMTSQNRLLYAPGIYDGKVFSFSKRNDKWELANTYSGMIHTDEAVELDEEDMAIVTYNSDGQMRSSGKINSYSVGLVQMNDGRVLHFSGQRVANQEELQMTVEVFSVEGKLLGTGPFDPITMGKNLGYFASHDPALWMDNNDRLYFIDYNDIPVVRIGRLDGLPGSK